MDPEERDRLTRVETKVEEIERKLERQEKTLAEIKSILTEARGGWKVLVLIGGAGAAFGAFALKVLDKVLP